MKPAETKRIYERECAARRTKFVQHEFVEWHTGLRGYELHKVEAALAKWNRSQERDSRGELKSKWLPKVQELEAVILADEREQSAERSFRPCNRSFERDGKQYKCFGQKAELLERDGIYWEAAGICPCRLKWESENARATA